MMESTLIHTIGLANGVILETAMIFVSYMFYKTYKHTGAVAARFLMWVLIVVSIVELPEVILRHGLGYHIELLEAGHDLLFVIVMLAMGWALWPKPTWTKMLKYKTDDEG